MNHEQLTEMKTYIDGELGKGKKIRYKAGTRNEEDDFRYLSVVVDERAKSSPLSRILESVEAWSDSTEGVHLVHQCTTYRRAATGRGVNYKTKHVHATEVLFMDEQFVRPSLGGAAVQGDKFTKAGGAV